MDEYIKREEAYEDFEKCNGENPKWTPSRVKTLIARQKAADVAPVRHGLWKPFSKTMYLKECSECGQLVEAKHNYHYCPDCGAKMDGGVNREAD